MKKKEQKNLSKADVEKKAKLFLKDLLVLFKKHDVRNLGTTGPGFAYVRFGKSGWHSYVEIDIDDDMIDQHKPVEEYRTEYKIHEKTKTYEDATK